MLDLVIAGGAVHDGRGRVSTIVDVAVSDGRVVAVGRIESPATMRIDASGMAVVPGFIDLHGHSDFSLFLEPSASSLIGQGVTTQVVGNCGASAFPLRRGIAASKFDPVGISRAWQSADAYLGLLDRQRFGINVAVLVGLGTIRTAILGQNANRPSSPDELRRIVSEVDAAMDSGASGISLGLHFEPDLHAAPQELVAVVERVARADGLVAIHLRDYGVRLAEAVDEAVELGQRTGARIHISLLHAFGRRAWGRLPMVLDRLDAARAIGVEVSCEALLWPTVGAWDGLRAVLPPDHYDWRQPNWEALARTLANTASRAALAAEIEVRRTAPKSGFYEEYLTFSDWRDIEVVQVPQASRLEATAGLSIAEAARRMRCPEVELFLDLVESAPHELMMLHTVLSESDIEVCVAWPHAYIGLDAIATSPSRQGEVWNTMQSHPRHFGGTARLFSHFVRARGLLSQAEAVRRLSGGPATVLGLPDRGVIEQGAVADLAVIDLNQFAPGGTWVDPVRPTIGLSQVVVAGQPQLWEQEGSRPMAGAVIRRGVGREVQ